MTFTDIAKKLHSYSRGNISNRRHKATDLRVRLLATKRKTPLKPFYNKVVFYETMNKFEKLKKEMHHKIKDEENLGVPNFRLTKTQKRKDFLRKINIRNFEKYCKKEGRIEDILSKRNFKDFKIFDGFHQQKLKEYINKKRRKVPLKHKEEHYDRMFWVEKDLLKSLSMNKGKKENNKNLNTRVETGWINDYELKLSGYLEEMKLKRANKIKSVSLIDKLEKRDILSIFAHVQSKSKGHYLALKIVMDELKNWLKKTLSQSVVRDDSKRLSEVLEYATHCAQEMLIKKYKKKCLLSLSILVLYKGKLYGCNLGGTRIFFINRTGYKDFYQPKQITAHHTQDNIRDMFRMQRKRNFSFVNIKASVPRSSKRKSDADLKQYRVVLTRGLGVGLPDGVIPKPDLKVAELDLNEQVCIFLGSVELWKLLPTQKVLNIVHDGVMLEDLGLCLRNVCKEFEDHSLNRILGKNGKMSEKLGLDDFSSLIIYL